MDRSLRYFRDTFALKLFDKSDQSDPLFASLMGGSSCHVPPMHQKPLLGFAEVAATTYRLEQATVELWEVDDNGGLQLLWTGWREC